MNDDTISAAEFRKLLRKPKPCFAWVNLYASDGEYLPVSKALLLQITSPESQSRYQAKERDNGIYIN